jgi:hypothetical protein
MGIFVIGDLPASMVIPSTSKVISNVISGHEDIDQQNRIDADTSLLASGYNSGALGSDRLSLTKTMHVNCSTDSMLEEHGPSTDSRPAAPAIHIETFLSSKGEPAIDGVICIIYFSNITLNVSVQPHETPESCEFCVLNTWLEYRNQSVKK